MSDDDSIDVGGTDGIEIGAGVDLGAIDSGTAAAAAPSEPPARTRKRRSDAGQPRGSTGAGTGAGKAKGKTSTSLDLSSLTGMFIGLHMAVARMTDIEELEITDQEGADFMKSAQKVASHYSVTTTQKTMDWIAFAGCAAAMYFPRAIVIARKKQSKPSKAADPFRVYTNGAPAE